MHKEIKMDYTYDKLKKMTVTELRDIAKDLDDESVKGYTQLNKEHLLGVLCKALGCEVRKKHEVVGINKREVKVKIREMKKERDEALAKGDKKTHKFLIRRIHKLKRKIHKATV